MSKTITWQGKESNVRLKQLESDITFHIGKQESELALRVNSAAYHGDLHQLKSLIRAGADPNKTDYDGRSPLVWFKLFYVVMSFYCRTLLLLNCSLWWLFYEMTNFFVLGNTGCIHFHFMYSLVYFTNSLQKSSLVCYLNHLNMLLSRYVAIHLVFEFYLILYPPTTFSLG